MSMAAPIKTVGGKRYMAQTIINCLPPRDRYTTFIDAMCRSCAVLLAHDPLDKSEIANDLDWRITTFFRVLQDPVLFERFRRRVECIPFSTLEFRAAKETLPTFSKPLSDAACVDLAVAFFVLARMSRAGDLEAFATLTKNRLRRRMNEQASAWLTSIEHLQAVHQRMRRVVVTDDDVFQLLDRWYNTDGVVIYLDPPYLIEAESGRATPKLYGEFDWDREKHERLLQALRRPGKALYLVSGYDTKLYEEELLKPGGWAVVKKPQPLHSAGGKKKRIQMECIFKNF